MGWTWSAPREIWGICSSVLFVGMDQDHFIAVWTCQESCLYDMSLTSVVSWLVTDIDIDLAIDTQWFVSSFRIRCSSGWHRTPAVAVLLSAYLEAAATGRCRYELNASLLFMIIIEIECPFLLSLLGSVHDISKSVSYPFSQIEKCQWVWTSKIWYC